MKPNIPIPIPMLGKTIVFERRATAYHNQKLLFVATSTSMSDRHPDIPELPDHRSLSATLAVSAKQRVFEKECDRCLVCGNNCI